MSNESGISEMAVVDIDSIESTTIVSEMAAYIVSIESSTESLAVEQDAVNSKPDCQKKKLRKMNKKTPKVVTTIVSEMAVLLGHRDMVWYLLEVTDNQRLTTQDYIEILVSSIDNDLLDVALHILENNKYLALQQDARGETALHALAKKPIKQDNGYQPCNWRIFSNSCRSKGEESKEALKLTEILWNEIIEQKRDDISASIRKPWRLLFVAAKLGKVEFLEVLIQAYPDLIWKVDENKYSIFHIAVIHRQVEIFKMIHEIGAIKELIATYRDTNENNMLHLAGILPPINRLSSVSGAVLQMQRELQWFEAVKQIVRSEYTEAENMNNKTPQALFSEAHETLRKQGEEWMKKTSESWALVAALIAIMVFSAAFQLPGGLNNDTGSPVLVKNTAFVFFAMSNAVSLFTSTASILMFLSILTSRYSEIDFLVSLPKKLMTGLILLLISIATMVVGFTVTFFITFREGLRWPPIIIAILALVPVTLFGLQQFPLLTEMYYKAQFTYTWLKPDISSCPIKERPVDYNLKSYLPPHRRLTDVDIPSDRRRHCQREALNIEAKVAGRRKGRRLTKVEMEFTFSLFRKILRIWFP